MAEWYCGPKGHVVNQPSPDYGLGRSWCRECESYIIPITETELKVLREAAGVQKPTWTVYENTGHMKGTWAFSCSGCGQCGGNYRDRQQAEQFAKKHVDQPHERKWLQLNEHI